MRLEQTIPDRHFPIRDELLGRTLEPGQLGDVARALAEGVGMYASYHAAAGEFVTRIIEAGLANSMPIIATLSPGYDVWVEIVPAQGQSCGFLFGPREGGTVRMRHIEGGRFGAPASCLPVSLLVRPCGDRPAVDWESVQRECLVRDDTAEEKWIAWGVEHILLEEVDGHPHSAAATAYFGKICAVDLVVAALTMSPLLRKRTPLQVFFGD